MLSITNPMLKRLMLEQIIELIDGGAMDELLEAGFSGEFLDSLRHRPARDLIKIADNPALGFRASVHEADVVSYLNRLDAMRRDDQRLEYFVRNGAPLRMICDYFRMSKEDVRALRNQLLSPDELSERDRMPSDEVRDAIHAHWHAITVTQPSLPPRERMYQLSQQFPNVRIGALCRALNEFNDTQPKWQVSDFGTFP